MRVSFIFDHDEVEEEELEIRRIEMSVVPRVGDAVCLTDSDEREVTDVTWFLDLDDAYPEVDHPYPLVHLGKNTMTDDTQAGTTDE